MIKPLPHRLLLHIGAVLHPPHTQFSVISGQIDPTTLAIGGLVLIAIFSLIAILVLVDALTSGRK